MTQGKLAAALVAAQKKMPEVPKTSAAVYGKYATLDSLIAKTRPILNECGLSIQQLPAVGELGQPVLRTIIRHESGEFEQADTPLLLPKQDMQALGAAITYARRYAWAAVLGIASEHDDDDAQSISGGEPRAVGAASAGSKSDAVRGGASRSSSPDPLGLRQSHGGFHAPDTGAPASQAQKGKIRAMVKTLGLSVEQVSNDIGDIDKLSKAQAHAAIEKLVKLEANRAAA